MDKYFILKEKNLDAAVDSAQNSIPAPDVMASELRQRILDNLTTAVILIDNASRLTAINAAGEALFGVSAKKVLGHTLAELLPNGLPLIKPLELALENRNPFNARGIRVQRPDLQWLTVDCAVTPLPDGGNGTELLVELTQIDRLLRLARDEHMLDRQIASRAVIGGLAHEIKNPLGGLRGAAQLLEHELSDSTLKEYTRIIIHEADRLRNLVDRMTGAYQPIKPRRLNIHEILEHIRRLIMVEVPTGLKILRDYDPSLPDMRGDPDQLTQAMLNIVRNALDALSMEGVIQLRTRIERQFTIGQKLHRLVLRVEIEDDGPGIPEDLADYVFYPMVTGRANGTGLGLSIAQDIISKHGGMIEYSSRSGQTIFAIFLPLDHATAETFDARGWVGGTSRHD